MGWTRSVAIRTLAAGVTAALLIAAGRPANAQEAAADEPQAQAAPEPDADVEEPAAESEPDVEAQAAPEAGEPAAAAEGAAETTTVIPEAGVGPGGQALSKDELLDQLRIRQAQLTLEQARADMERAKVEYDEALSLFNEKVYTVEQLNKAEQEMEQAVLEHAQAQIDLQRTRLEFLTDATLITVVDAKKYRGEEDEVFARIMLKNDSDMNKARVVMEESEDFAATDLKALLDIDNVLVSLRKGNAIISDPYQQIVPELHYGEEKQLTFRLLDPEQEEVTVSIEFLGTEQEYTVVLKKEAVQDLPTIRSNQYAQQGELGSKVTYDLELERLAKTEQSFSLVVLNLPQEIPFAFLDPGSGARITQLRFNRRITKQNLNFEVSVPEKLDQSMVDTEIRFTILVVRHEDLPEVYELRTKHKDERVPAQEVAKLKGNRTTLILIPKGTGKLEMVVGNAFREVLQNEPVQLKFNALNAGTLALRRVSPELVLPLEWEGALTPKSVELLEPGDKVLITADITPPQDVPVGEYTVTAECEGYSGIETVEAEDKDFTVRVVAESNITGTLILVGVLVALVLFIAIASIKISRR